MAKQLTLEEIRACRRSLETKLANDIAVALAAFNEQTGLYVQGLDVEFVRRELVGQADIVPAFHSIRIYLGTI